MPFPKNQKEKFFGTPSLQYHFIYIVPFFWISFLLLLKSNLEVHIYGIMSVDGKLVVFVYLKIFYSLNSYMWNSRLTAIFSLHLQDINLFYSMYSYWTEVCWNLIWYSFHGETVFSFWSCLGYFNILGFHCDVIKNAFIVYPHFIFNLKMCFLNFEKFCFFINIVGLWACTMYHQHV